MGCTQSRGFASPSHLGFAFVVLPAWRREVCAVPDYRDRGENVLAGRWGAQWRDGPGVGAPGDLCDFTLPAQTALVITAALRLGTVGRCRGAPVIQPSHSVTYDRAMRELCLLSWRWRFRLWRDEPITRDNRPADQGAGIDDCSGDAHERTTDVAEHRPIPGRSEPPVATPGGSSSRATAPQSGRPHVDARPVHANGVPVRWPRRLAVYDDIWAFDLASGMAELDPGGRGPAARFGHEAVWVDGVGLVVGRPGGPDRLLRRPWAYDPVGKRLVAPPERRVETRRPLWLVLGRRHRRAAVDQPRLHRGRRPLLGHPRVRLHAGRWTDETPTASSRWCAASMPAG